MLEMRFDDSWDYDSRIEVFENLRTRIEEYFSKSDNSREIEKKCESKVDHIYLYDEDIFEGNERKSGYMYIEISFEGEK